MSKNTDEAENNFLFLHTRGDFAESRRMLSRRQVMSKDKPSVIGRNSRTSESLEEPDYLSLLFLLFMLKPSNGLNARQSKANKATAELACRLFTCAIINKKAK